MPAFVFANIQSVSSPARFAEYQGLAEPTVIQYGGKFLGGGTNIEIADGDWSPVGVMAGIREPGKGQGMVQLARVSGSRRWAIGVYSGRLDIRRSGLVGCSAKSFPENPIERRWGRNPPKYMLDRRRGLDAACDSLHPH